MAKIRGTHSSPGVYTKITDVTYPAQSVGMTTLGVVGETLKGPAFEPVMVKNWAEYKQYFGGTSPEKFPETKYPKYELPYIAKSYLSESDQLYVTRVLGLSGYYAGPAWLITAQSGSDVNADKYVVAVIRSKADYEPGGTNCNGSNKKQNDYLDFKVSSITLSTYTNYSFDNKCGDVNVKSGETSNFSINTENYGRFDLKCTLTAGGDVTYSVSLNSDDKDYIIDVLGMKPDEGKAPIYVEELYDYSLKELIENNDVDQISSSATTLPNDSTTYEEVDITLSSSTASAELSAITQPCSSGYPSSDMVENLFTLTSSGNDHYVFYDETKTNTEKMVQGGVYVVKSGTAKQSIGGNSYHFEEIIKGLNLLDGYGEYPNRRKVLKISKPEANTPEESEEGGE